MWLRWIFSAVIHSLVITLFAFIFLEYNYMPNGHMVDYWTTGTAIFSAIVILTNVEVFFMHHVHSLISNFFIWGSIIIYIFILAIVSCFFYNSSIYLCFNILMSCPGFYFYIIFVLYACNIFTNSITKIQRLIDNIQQNKISHALHALVVGTAFAFKRRFTGYAFSK